ncbi:MAG: DUF5591 domain-containing protein [Candidatus Parvarchaeota archaeon]
MSYAESCEHLEKYIGSGEKIIKKPGFDPFQHPVVKKWHEYFLNNWHSEKEIALLLPCTSVKPYNRSATHKLAYSLLRKYKLEDKVQVYSVSEPMLLVPRELENCYPFNSYDYPPSLMTEEEKQEFIRLLSIALSHVHKIHKRIIAVLPKHHYKIVYEASKNVPIELYPYGKLAFKTIANVISGLRDRKV